MTFRSSVSRTLLFLCAFQTTFCADYAKPSMEHLVTISLGALAGSASAAITNKVLNSETLWLTVDDMVPAEQRRDATRLIYAIAPTGGSLLSWMTLNEFMYLMNAKYVTLPGAVSATVTETGTKPLLAADDFLYAAAAASYFVALHHMTGLTCGLPNLSTKESTSSLACISALIAGTTMGTTTALLQCFLRKNIYQFVTRRFGAAFITNGLAKKLLVGDMYHGAFWHPLLGRLAIGGNELAVDILGASYHTTHVLTRRNYQKWQ